MAMVSALLKVSRTRITSPGPQVPSSPGSEVIAALAGDTPVKLLTGSSVKLGASEVRVNRLRFAVAR